MELSPAEALAIIEYVLAAENCHDYDVPDDIELAGGPLFRRCLDEAAGLPLQCPWEAHSYMEDLTAVPTAAEYDALMAEGKRRMDEAWARREAEYAARAKQERDRRAALAPEERAAEDLDRQQFSALGRWTTMPGGGSQQQKLAAAVKQTMGTGRRRLDRKS